MATNNTKSVTDAPKKTAKASAKVEEAPAPQVSVYSAAELARAHTVFDTSYEIVAVALKQAGKENATVSEAKAIVEKFKNKEVK